MYTLQNNQLKVTINPFGAELTSVKDINDNFEYMYDANPKFWKRHAPNLFPIVGRLKDNTYIYKGKKYEMSQHGFARDEMFEIINQTDTSLEFQLQETAETLKKYPFRFKFIIVYELSENHIDITYQVYNPSDSNLLFSVGAHPAFAFDYNQNIEDYQITFEPSIKNHQYELVGPYVNEVPTIKDEMLTSIPLNMTLFKNDALIYNDKIDKISLSSTKSNHKVNVYMEDFPYVGIWTTLKENELTPFLCIEPWHGIADTVNHDQNFETKKEMITLSANKTFKTTYRIEFER